MWEIVRVFLSLWTFLLQINTMWPKDDNRALERYWRLGITLDYEPPATFLGNDLDRVDYLETVTVKWRLGLVYRQYWRSVYEEVSANVFQQWVIWITDLDQTLIGIPRKQGEKEIFNWSLHMEYLSAFGYLIWGLVTLQRCDNVVTTEGTSLEGVGKHMNCHQTNIKPILYDTTVTLKYCSAKRLYFCTRFYSANCSKDVLNCDITSQTL